jgi:phosphotransacetylase
MAREGKAQAIMKGALHTDELIDAVISAEGGLRTDRRMSHVFVVDTPAYPKLLLVTDAAVNICPDLMQKRDIAQNAIDLAIAIGIETPKLAVLCAVETVTPRMQATIDAASLCKMAERGQIRGGIVDGPLAFDNAISAEAAKAKGISSRVAGDADILLVPDINVGNVLAKEMDYLAGALMAGLLVGARTPVILSSRSDGAAARLAACALAHFYIPPPGPTAA